MKNTFALLFVAFLAIGIVYASGNPVPKENTYQKQTLQNLNRPLPAAVEKSAVDATAKLRKDLKDIESEYNERLRTNQEVDFLLPEVNRLRGKLGLPLRSPSSLDQGGETCATARVISSLPFSDQGTTDNTNECYPYDDGPTCDKWYRYTAAWSGSHTISMCGTTSPAKRLVVWTSGTCCSGSRINVETNCSGSDSSPTTTVALTQGQTIIIHVGHWYPFGCEGYSYNLQVTGPMPPPTGRCCYGDDPYSPQCATNTQEECSALSGVWTSGQSCSNPCPTPCPYTSLDIEPSNDSCGDNVPEIFCGDTLCGERSPGSDSDWYKFVVPTGGYSTVTIDVFGNETPGIWPYHKGLDPTVALYESDCTNQIDLNDDNYGPPGPVDYDSRIVTTEITAGTYYIKVYGWQTSVGPYVLALECAEPLIGRCCYMEVTGAPACADNTLDECAQLLGTWDGNLTCADNPCPVPCPYPSLDIEPMNSDFNNAENFPEISCGDTLCGEGNYDYDFYRVVIPEGEYWELTIDVYADDTPGFTPYGQGLDAKLAFAPSTGQVIYDSHDNNGPPGPLGTDCRVVTDALEAGTYYILVKNANETSGPYILTLDCAVPQLGRCCYGSQHDPSCDLFPESFCSQTLYGIWNPDADCSTPCEDTGCACGSAEYSHCNTVGGSIEDNTVQEFIIEVPYEYIITDVNICWTLLHTYDGDLVISLVSPVGTEIALSTNNGQWGNDMFCTTIDDEGDSLIANGHAPFTGSYIPEEPLSTFNGENARGNWILKIEDTSGSDTGRLIAACLTFEFDEILPVELSSFDAIPGDRSITLNWTTASESDNDRFDIIRDETLVGRVTASNTPSGDSYSWTESNLVNGREYTYKLIAVDINGNSEEIAVVLATPSFNAATITEYALHQNYPNPFNPSTSITFDLVEAGHTRIVVYNSLGQTLATVVNEQMAAGRHAINFNAEALPSGLYFYRMEAGEFTAIKKMILMK